MDVDNVMIRTGVATAGMTVREVFAECSRANTPGLPFCDANGTVIGRVTLKNILKKSCLPDYLVEMARVLGEQVSGVQDMEARVKDVLGNPIDAYVQAAHLSLSSGSSVVKALAMMEQSDTSYIYVVDDGRYQGVITIHCLADALSTFDTLSP